MVPSGEYWKSAKGTTSRNGREHLPPSSVMKGYPVIPSLKRTEWTIAFLISCVRASIGQHRTDPDAWGRHYIFMPGMNLSIVPLAGAFRTGTSLPPSIGSL